MVKKNGVFSMRTAEEKELDKRMKDVKQEVMENYGAQKEERRETVASSHITYTKTQRSLDRGEEFITSLERGREDRDLMEGRPYESQVNNRLHSTPVSQQHSYSEPHTYGQELRTPSFRLSAGKSQWYSSIIKL